MNTKFIEKYELLMVLYHQQGKCAGGCGVVLEVDNHEQESSTDPWGVIYMPTDDVGKKPTDRMRAVCLDCLMTMDDADIGLDDLVRLRRLVRIASK